MKNGLKLFLWPEHQRDWSPGCCFALAHNETQARELIRAHPNNWEEPNGSPEVYDEPFGFSRTGGG